MGGKPSPGTSPDRRLKANQPKTAKPTWMKPATKKGKSK